MVRLALAIFALVGAVSSASAASLPQMQAQETDVLSRRSYSSATIQSEIASDPDLAAALSGLDLSAINQYSSHAGTSSGLPKQFNFDFDSDAGSDSGSGSGSDFGLGSGTTTVTIDNSVTSSSDYSGNTGTIIGRRAVSTSLPAREAAPSNNKPPAKDDKNKKPDDKKDDKNTVKAAAAIGGALGVLEAAHKAAESNKGNSQTTVNSNSSSKSTTNVNSNNKVTNINKSTNQANNYSNNQGQIVDSGNVNTESCTVNIEMRSFVDGVLEARDARRRDAGMSHCVCNCGGQRRRSLGTVAIGGPDAQFRSLKARLEPSCSIMKDEASGQHLWAGSCANSSLLGRDITDVLPPFAVA